MLDAADGESVRTVAVVLRIHSVRRKPQVAAVDTAGRVRRRRPTVATRANVVQTAAIGAIAVTGSKYKSNRWNGHNRGDIAPTLS